MSATKAKPKNLPKPTYWPFMLAFGCSLFLWGLLYSVIFSLAGLILFSLAIGGWMNDLYKELKKQEK